MAKWIKIINWTESNIVILDNCTNIDWDEKGLYIEFWNNQWKKVKRYDNIESYRIDEQIIEDYLWVNI